MSPKWFRLNTLRNQMLVGFLLGMIVILCLVGFMTYDSVSTLLQNNAEKLIQKTAVQSSGRLEAILMQVDTLTTQVATNVDVQRALEKEWNGKRVTFSEQQELVPRVNIVQTYASGIHSVELFTAGNRRLYPLDGASLDRVIPPPWIERAREGQGRLVWIGIDPANPHLVMAIRSVSLINESFTPGGYLLVRIHRAAFEIGTDAPADNGRETMLVAGPDRRLIAASDSRFSDADVRRLLEAPGPTVDLGGERYMIVREQSAATGWTLLILTPVRDITRGVSVLQKAVVVSAGTGTILFVVFSFALSTLITRPIFKLIKQMRKMRLGTLQPTDEISSTLEINELNKTYNQMVENMNDLIRLVYEKEILQSRTELKALQAQINPHFLFNTLDALYWSLLEKDEDELADYVVTMSELFRYTINHSAKDEWVTLGDELEHIERYLAIMKMRFGDRLTWTVAADPELLACRLPKLLLQPVVENAVLHGLEGKFEPGAIRITVRRTEGNVELVVEDDGAGMDEAALDRLERALHRGEAHPEDPDGVAGVGLRNVQRRIRLYYGDMSGNSGGISISSRKGEGTAVRITIPAIMEGKRS